MYRVNFKPCRADRLKVGDLILDENNKPIKIVDVRLVEFTGNIHNIIAGEHHILYSKYEHIIIANGMFSGDLMEQMESETIEDGLPSYGSNTYGPINKRSEPFPPELNIVEKFLYPEFPLDTVSFIDANATPKIGTTHPPTSSFGTDWVQIIKRLVSPVFNITIETDYVSNHANIFIFPEKRIVIHGGMIRHKYLGFEGLLAAVLSSASVYVAGEPKRPGFPWASCAGVSDYYAGTYGFREVWYGQAAINMQINGVTRLKKFLEHGLVYDKVTTIENSCSFPSSECRFKTMMGGVYMEPIHECAN